MCYARSNCTTPPNPPSSLNLNNFYIHYNKKPQQSAEVSLFNTSSCRGLGCIPALPIIFIVAKVDLPPRSEVSVVFGCRMLVFAFNVICRFGLTQLHNCTIHRHLSLSFQPYYLCYRSTGNYCPLQYVKSFVSL